MITSWKVSEINSSWWVTSFQKTGSISRTILHPDDPSGWRELSAFRNCVLEPLCWAGLLVEIEAEQQRLGESQYFKTPLWSSALKLDTNDMLEHAQRH
ncbi:MAG: hypothetical protein V7695_24480 [Sulfitobacter sp.]